MDFLEKLNYLMKSNNLNKSTLAKACDIPYTTVDGWYKRGYEGLKLPTLKKLSGYFGISLDYWADDNLLEPVPLKNDALILTKKETNVIEGYRKLNSTAQSIIEQIIEYENSKR